MGSTGTNILEGEGGPARQWLMGTKAFEARMPHHDGIKALWETKWKFPVSGFFAFEPCDIKIEKETILKSEYGY